MKTYHSRSKCNIYIFCACLKSLREPLLIVLWLTEVMKWRNLQDLIGAPFCSKSLRPIQLSRTFKTLNHFNTHRGRWQPEQFHYSLCRVQFRKEYFQLAAWTWIHGTQTQPHFLLQSLTFEVPPWGTIVIQPPSVFVSWESHPDNHGSLTLICLHGNRRAICVVTEMRVLPGFGPLHKSSFNLSTDVTRMTIIWATKVKRSYKI